MIPDVSLQKARLARIHLAGKADIWSDNGYGFAVEEPEGVLGRTFAVEAVAYDLDGQPGLNVPNSRERTALKEALASVGQTAGTSVNVTRSAGQQVLSELARGGLQASSQYVAGKLREVKITLKANHQLLLISKQQ